MEMLQGFDVEPFRRSLLAWWQENRRDYPWRNTRNPYEILVAEVLLHRTRADQVVPVYRAFLEKFPTPQKLAGASLNELEELTNPLGLFWRIELLHKMAKDLVSRFEGKVPESREILESLPGVSHYIATAVRCFAYGCPDAILDTNTVRICGRLFGLKVNDGSRRNKKFRKILEKLIKPQQPREFNYALVDHGALVCRSRNPLCSECPVSQQCVYARSVFG